MLKEIFSRNLHTESKTVCNAIITLGDIDDSGKGKRFKSRFIQPGLAGYPGQFGTVLVKKETLDSSLNTIIGAPVIINHTNVTEENANDLRVGVISNAYYNEKDGWYWCDGVIWDETAQNLITDKNWSVSCSYDFLEENDEGGTENNIPYDREFTKLNFVHLALVDNPRYERANIVFNSKMVENSFPNHKGRKGQVGGSLPRRKSMPSKEDYKNPQKDYELPPISDDILKKLGKEQKTLVLKKNIIEKNKEHHPEVDIEEYNDILDNGIYKADVIFKTKNNDEYYNFAHYDSDGNPQILVELADNKDHYEIVNFYKMSDKNLQRKLKQAIKRVDNEGGQFLIDIEDNTSKVGVLSNLEIDSIYSITDNQEDFKPDITNHEVNNEKEQRMALLEELKKLINNVENDKGKEMNRDKEVDNQEKEDEKSSEKKEKEDKAENKYDNFVNNGKIDYFAELNKVYNTALEPPKQDMYVSQADRLAAADEYFK